MPYLGRRRPLGSGRGTYSPPVVVTGPAEASKAIPETPLSRQWKYELSILSTTPKSLEEFAVFVNTKHWLYGKKCADIKAEAKKMVEENA